MFNADNAFWRFMGKVADVIILNVLFLIGCVPIVTIGASATALYSVMLKLVKNEESYVFKGFVKAYKENFKQSTIIWLILLFVGLLLAGDLYLTTYVMKGNTTILKYLFGVFAFLYLMIASYVFPILSKFDNTVKNTLKNAAIMSIAHFPWTLLLVIVNMIPAIVLFINLGYIMILIPIMIVVGFGLLAFINSFIFNRIFKRYIPEEAE